MTFHPIDHPAAWKSADFASEDDYAFDLDDRHLRALAADLAEAKKTANDVQDLTAEHFPLADIADDLADVRETLLHGRGLVLMRGFPVDDFSVEDIGMMYWGIGAHFGRGVSQSPMGDRLGYVTDVSKPGERERGYRSASELRLHTDSDDIISLLCIRQAKSGGLSKLVSGYAIYNEILATRPDLLPPLVDGFRYHWFGEEPPGEPPITPYKLPVFSWVDDVMSICYLREFMEMAADELDEPLTEQQVEALDLFEEIAHRDDVLLQFMHRPGNAMFVNNYTLLHSRTGFEDWPEPERKRLLLRLWLKAESDRPVNADLRTYYGVDGMHIDGRTSTVYQPGTSAVER